MKLLGIETSCDETAVAVVTESGTILAQRLTRQIEHERWGGVVPETASRAHLELLDTAVQATLAEAEIAPQELAAIAVTVGPGLAGPLWVGVSYADGFAFSAGITLVPVHHLEAHLWSVLLTEPALSPPFLALLVSGGHTLLVKVDGFRRYEVLGETRDDAAGEAFDKAARLLGLGFPGGPAIAAAADGVTLPSNVTLPIPDLAPSCDFSFSGLKTALRLGIASHPEVAARQWAALFEQAETAALLRPVKRAWRRFPGLPLALAGGVAASSLLRFRLQQIADEQGCRFIAAPIEVCTDNGVMIAFAGIQSLLHQRPLPSRFSVRPRWHLREISE